MAKETKSQRVSLDTPLTVDEIEFRIQSISKSGYATILPYKDARVDMKRLDDVYGPEYWQKKYSVVINNLFCSIAIWNNDIQQWVWKEDVGVESMAEKEKGQASDALKRAGFNLGIGRELYDYPRIFLQLKPNEFKVVKKGQKEIGQQTYDLKLDKWKWEVEFDGKIPKRVQGWDQDGAPRFDSDKDFNPAPKGNEPKKEEPKQQQSPTKKEPSKPAPKQETKAPSKKEETIKKIITAFENSKTKEELAKHWGNVPPALKKEDRVLRAKNAKKAKFETAKAS